MIINRNANDNPGFIVDYNVASSLCSIWKISNQQPLNSSENFIRRRPMSNADNAKSFDVKYKVLLLGDTLVGKTSLQRFIAGKDFRPDIGSTIGVDFVNKITSVERAKVNLQIWDMAGQKNFRTIGKSHYASTKAFVLVYDVTNEETFRLIEQFSQYIEDAGLDIERRYLVANKIDLTEKRVVDEETGRRFAARNTMIYFETSCKTGENISDLIEQIASDLARQHNPKILESHKPRDNFVYNYHTANHEIHGDNNEQTTNSTNQSKTSRSLINKNYRFNFRRLLFCCNPKPTTATLN